MQYIVPCRQRTKNAVSSTCTVLLIWGFDDLGGISDWREALGTRRTLFKENVGARYPGTYQYPDLSIFSVFRFVMGTRSRWSVVVFVFWITFL